ncbi:fatty-acid amide hydrolase 1-like [Motacilla alba alba]|uniref:fatty-acid amide hydrolase 1-like n=1 Tax=Motacilla alba alba TaxID=1094192 RepID=UPI0018D4DB5D|nr:fatty-acid amide hydrolase 1-like [Motacilla alba alba]
MDEARRSRHLAQERMEKATRRFKQENPGTQASQILSLTMVELAEKLKEGSLSPGSVLYSYMDKAYPTELIAKWRQLRLDVILCPVLGPAFNHGYAGKLFAAASCTNLYKVLDFPAGVVPVSRVTRAEEEELKHYRGHSRDLWDKRLREASRKRAQVLEPAE